MARAREPSERWDVVVVGGGPSGLSTALHLLARAPRWAGRVLVLEKAHHPRHKLCGGGITEHGLAVLAGLGLDVWSLPVVRIEEMRVVRGRECLSLPRGFGLHVVRRDGFDAWLAHHLVARGGALRQGEEVREVHVGRAGVDVETERGRIRARTLVVADGSNGQLRRQLGLDDAPRVARALELLTPVDDRLSRALFHGGVALFDYSASSRGLQGYYWDFPCIVGGVPHVNRGVYDARIVPERPRADLKAILGDALERRGIDLARCDLMGHPIRWFVPEARLSKPRVLLVGDAAGADPLLGEGIAFALAYGRVAAEAIDDAFARDDHRFGDYRQRFLASREGEILSSRVAQARELYRHAYPKMVPGFDAAVSALR